MCHLLPVSSDRWSCCSFFLLSDSFKGGQVREKEEKIASDESLLTKSCFKDQTHRASPNHLHPNLNGECEASYKLLTDSSLAQESVGERIFCSFSETILQSIMRSPTIKFVIQHFLLAFCFFHTLALDLENPECIRYEFHDRISNGSTLASSMMRDCNRRGGFIDSLSIANISAAQIWINTTFECCGEFV